ncbi:MAG: EamA family transporter [bacterium]|nr:EamA family transporter [bacterium]MDE0288850.1 EamA family transporter [bacterium]MDE0438596.1 EamA family transporter [bacterium]
MAILLAALTSVFYGVFDFAGGMATRRVHVFAVAFWSNLTGLALSGVIAFLYHLVFGASVTVSDLAWGALSGVAAVAGVVFYFEGLAKGQMAVVAPVSAVTLALVPFLFGFLTGERYALLAWIGVVVAAPALWLTVATPTREDRPGKAIYGLGAGLGFSLMFIGLAQVSGEAGMWTLIPFKCASVGAAAVLVRVQGIPLGLPRKNLLLSFAAGGSVLANLTYLLAVRSGPLGLVAVASSLYPAVVAVMAFLVYKEKAPPQRIAGLLLSLVALSLIAL